MNHSYCKFFPNDNDITCVQPPEDCHDEKCAIYFGYQKGREDAIEEAIKLIEEMQETAEAQMMFKHVDACECIIKQIEQMKWTDWRKNEQKNSPNNGRNDC